MKPAYFELNSKTTKTKTQTAFADLREPNEARYAFRPESGAARPRALLQEQHTHGALQQALNVPAAQSHTSAGRLRVATRL